MSLNELISMHIDRLLRYSLREELICSLDLPYCRNLLLDLFHLDAPYEYAPEDSEPLPGNAAPLLHSLCDDAVAAGLIEDLLTVETSFQPGSWGR